MAELCIAKEPLLPLWLLRRRIPLLVGISNFLVPQCNFAVMYFFPLWFESVQLASTSEAGEAFSLLFRVVEELRLMGFD